MSHKKCVIAVDNQSDTGKIHVVDKYELLNEKDGLEWGVVKWGRLPERAVSIGYLSNRQKLSFQNSDRRHGYSQQSLFACRIVDWNGATRMGWSVYGGLCVFNRGGQVITGATQTRSGDDEVSILMRKNDEFLHVNTRPTK